ncbi:enoyl-CoA hydratase [Gordonia desulfuricans]|uniref:Enoyl-CoA hydratase domain-containing protein 3, mitochondrial n=1 Tax=Gordonia desulfuricans TaxID=89051 RepID=A0A7K3LKE2_9ACTN|nr:MULTISPECIES: enoyl-CoA hydratase [Gordonia]EMP13969.1 enoyl-CoA hydratase [Gordonia sp. NB41Y]NDK88017.1 enoyl-CoA hydratase [Gordonia desulfuricans]WLP90004.1 enoyl-CoA hydratase [Gordonia sp. NB41Y]
MEQTANVEQAGPIEVGVTAPLGVITLANARRRNPLSSETMRAITAALRGFADDTAVRVVIIRALGPAFSAGHDLGELVDRTLEDEQAVFDTCVEMMTAVHDLDKPVIAEVSGMAFAAGCQLVATCDLAVASSAATFSTPGVRIGLFCSTPMVAVTRAIGRKRAMKMLLTGDPIDAATAADWGLVNDVVDPDDLEGTVRDLALSIAGSSAATLAIGKRAFYRQIDETEPRAYQMMSETMATNAMTCDAQEGMSAFLAKRHPVWTDS